MSAVIHISLRLGQWASPTISFASLSVFLLTQGEGAKLYKYILALLNRKLSE